MRHPDRRGQAHPEGGRPLPPARPDHHLDHQPAGPAAGRRGRDRVPRLPRSAPRARPTRRACPRQPHPDRRRPARRADRVRAGLGITTYVSGSRTQVSVSVSAGVATVDFAVDPVQLVGPDQTLAIAQVVYTVTQISGISRRRVPDRWPAQFRPGGERSPGTGAGQPPRLPAPGSVVATAPGSSGECDGRAVTAGGEMARSGATG